MLSRAFPFLVSLMIHQRNIVLEVRVMQRVHWDLYPPNLTWHYFIGCKFWVYLISDTRRKETHCTYMPRGRTLLVLRGKFAYVYHKADDTWTNQQRGFSYIRKQKAGHFYFPQFWITQGYLYQPTN